MPWKLWIVSLTDSSSALVRQGGGPFRPIGWSRDGQWIYGQPADGSVVVKIRVSDGKEESVISHPYISLCPSMTFELKRFACTVVDVTSDAWVVENFDSFNQ